MTGADLDWTYLVAAQCDSVRLSISGRLRSRAVFELGSTSMAEFHTDVESSYAPSPEFVAQANAKEDLYREAEADRLEFWAKQAKRLSWDKPFDEVLDWSEAPLAKWFVGGELNVAHNCVDRHVEAGNGDRVA